MDDIQLKSLTSKFEPMSRWTALIGFLLMALLAACQTQPNQIFIEVDGGRQALTTQAGTVREALAEAKITLAPLDRVKPDLYAQLEPGLVIVVTRVAEEINSRREVVPFERQIVTNEALAAGESKMAQLGVNGEDEISIRVVYENGIEVSRTEISRRTVIQPVPEILVVGPEGELPAVPIEGTIVYLSNGNAWLMRASSTSRRALTSEGNLDGRVLGLSPDGRQLLFTTAVTDEIDLPLNELWLASTTIVGEKPITLGIQGVLQADWSPVISQSQVAYTTAERVANPPGWKANNDLWLLTVPPPAPNGEIQPDRLVEPEQLLSPSTPGLYPWWGTTFSWSPRGDRLAYARADEIGIIDLSSSEVIADSVTTLAKFTPLKTFSEWVWVPVVSWSPDGQFLAAAIHGLPLANEPADESPIFDLWLFSVDGRLSAKVTDRVGMWTNPVWGKAGIAFGAAVNPLQSVNSRYTIQLIDRDGSNKRQLFPFQSEPGVQFPELAWSPGGDELLFIYNGNLYLTTSRGTPPQQLTVDGQASQPQWVAKTIPLTSVTTLTGTDGLTGSNSITTYGTITGEGAIDLTNSATVTTTTSALTPTVSITDAVIGSPAISLTRTLTPEATQPTPTRTISPTITATLSNSVD